MFLLLVRAIVHIIMHYLNVPPLSRCSDLSGVPVGAFVCSKGAKIVCGIYKFCIDSFCATMATETIINVKADV